MAYLTASSRNATGIAITAGVHALLGAALLTLGVVSVGPVLEPPIKTVNIPEKRRSEPVPAPLQRFEDIAVDYVPPVIDIAVDNPVKDTRIDIDEPPLPGSGDGTGLTANPPQPAADPILVAARLDRRFAARFQPPYPTSALRREVEGTVGVRVVVGADGRVVRAEVERSSGDEALDQAAVQHALRAWRFVPATRDGTPVEAWRTIPVTFELKNA